MALIWQKQVDGVDYQVRSAGQTRRLYSNGVFHSQFNPRTPVGGSVWDLLLLTAFFQDLPAHPRILVLGVGGGAVIRQLQYFLGAVSITGVDINPVHLRVARRFFGVRGRGIELLEADAIHWVEHWQGEPYDLIIDDLFGHADGEPCRAIAADGHWFMRLQRLLRPGGTLAFNFDTPAGLQACGWCSEPGIAARFASGWGLSTPLYENCVGVFTRERSSRDGLLERLQQFPELDVRRKSCRLRVRLMSLAKGAGRRERLNPAAPPV